MVSSSGGGCCGWRTSRNASARWWPTTASASRCGPGRSTLGSLLYGLYAPDEGRILLEGRPVQIPSPKAAQALGIALVPQHPELIEAHTVAENLALGLDLPFLLPRRALVRRLKALLAGHPLGVDL